MSEIREWYDSFCACGGCFGYLDTCPHPWVPIVPWLGHNGRTMEPRGIRVIKWIRENAEDHEFILVNQHEDKGTRYCTYDNRLDSTGSVVAVIFADMTTAIQFKLTNLLDITDQ